MILEHRNILKESQGETDLEWRTCGDVGPQQPCVRKWPALLQLSFWAGWQLGLVNSRQVSFPAFFTYRVSLSSSGWPWTFTILDSASWEAGLPGLHPDRSAFTVAYRRIKTLEMGVKNQAPTRHSSWQLENNSWFIFSLQFVREKKERWKKI